MRILVILVFTCFIGTAHAQYFGQLPGFARAASVASLQNIRVLDSSISKKWFVTTQKSIAASYVFSSGGGASIFSVPVVIQLNRKLNDNVYAFANVAIAPSLVTFNGAAANMANGKMPGIFNNSSFHMYTSAQVGMQYVNDSKTFSISGSFGVSRSTYPFQGNFGAQPVATKQLPVP